MKFEVELKVFGKTMRTTVEAANANEAWQIAHRAASDRIQCVELNRVNRKEDAMSVFEDIFGTRIK